MDFKVNSIFSDNTFKEHFDLALLISHIKINRCVLKASDNNIYHPVNIHTAAKQRKKMIVGTQSAI